MSAPEVTGASAEAIPFRRDDSQAFAGSSFMGAAIILIGLGAFAFWAWRRKQNKQEGGSARFPWFSKVEVTNSPRLISRTVLSPQVALHVIEWRGEELLLGCTSHSVNVLGRHPVSQLDGANEKVGQ